LRDSIEEKFVKSIRYVAEDSSGNEDEKFQKIYENHIENKKVKYRKVKPITILVTKNIAACKRLTDKLIDFLAKKEKINKEKAEEKVLIVTSANEHKSNIPVLRRVDDKDNPVEWITSVSMLSEGWDVKNVFQIVPHEERAFNSKLLIAQVLGRGLRIPEVYRGSQPVVTVFNHDKWSSSIKHLVDEVLEIEKRIHSYPVKKKEDYSFDLYQIDYEKVIDEIKEYPKEDEFELLKKGYITYSSQDKIVPEETEYETVITGIREKKEYFIAQNMHPIDEVANDIFNRLYVFDMDAGTNYSEQWPKEKIIKIIRQSLLEVKDKTGMISEENRQKTLQAFGVIKRKSSTFPRIVPKSKEPYKINTKEIKTNSFGVGTLSRDSTVFFDDYSLILGIEEDIKLLKELDEDERLPKSAMIKVENRYNFKTPLNVVLASYEPERKFIKGLIGEQTAKVVDSWIKSLDVGFYKIEYSWRKGEHPKQGSFNPDFFIKIGNDILVIEIKDDKAYEGIAGEENRKKLEYAREHFDRLNELQKVQKYYFKFLSPISYDLFFKALRENNYKDFKSEIEARLEE
jgi:type III restriction enzyme